MEYIQNVE